MLPVISTKHFLRSHGYLLMIIFVIGVSHFT